MSNYNAVTELRPLIEEYRKACSDPKSTVDPLVVYQKITLLLNDLDESMRQLRSQDGKNWPW
jgi:hypothetical protein